MNRNELLKQSQLNPNQFAELIKQLEIKDGDWFEQADCDRVLEAVTQPDPELNSNVDGNVDGNVADLAIRNMSQIQKGLFSKAEQYYLDAGDSAREAGKQLSQQGNEYVANSFLEGLLEGNLGQTVETYAVDVQAAPKLSSSRLQLKQSDRKALKQQLALKSATTD